MKRRKKNSVDQFEADTLLTILGVDDLPTNEWLELRCLIQVQENGKKRGKRPKRQILFQNGQISRVLKRTT